MTDADGNIALGKLPDGISRVFVKLGITEREWSLPFVQPSLPSELTIVADSAAEVCSAWICAAMQMGLCTLRQTTGLGRSSDIDAPVAVQFLQAIVDYVCSATSAATLRSEGIQLLRQAAPCGSHSARQHYGHLQSGGTVCDLADCLGITHDGRLAMRNVLEGAHKLYLPRLHQVRRCHILGSISQVALTAVQGVVLSARRPHWVAYH